MAKSMFAGWKKFSTNGKNTIMSHPNGHKMVLNHKSLKPEHLAELHALPFAGAEKQEVTPMAKGGDPTQQHLLPGDAIPNQIEKGVVANAKSRMADGGQVPPKPAPKSSGHDYQVGEEGSIGQKITKAVQSLTGGYAEGGDVEEPLVDPQALHQAEVYNSLQTQKQAMPAGPMTAKTGNPEANNASLIKFGPDGKPVSPEGGFDPRTAAETQGRVQQEAVDNQQQGAQKAAQSAEQANIAAQFGATPPPTPPGISPQDNPQAQQQQDQQQPQDPLAAEAGAIQKAQALGMQGIQGEAQAQGQVASEQSDILRRQADHEQRVWDNFQAESQSLNQQLQHAANDVRDGHIDPNQFWGEKSLPGKISTALGLILGGIGGGLMHQENPALKFIQSQIDRNIEAQKVGLGQKRSFLDALHKQYGNMKDASDMARLHYAAVTADQIQQAALKQGTPLAQARAQQAQGALMAQYAPLLSRVAMSQAMMKEMNNPQTQGDPNAMGMAIQKMRFYNPEMAKSMEQRYVPGIGLAQVPVPQEVRDKLVAGQDAETKLAKLEQFAQKHSGSLDPQIINEGKALSADAQSAVRTAQHQGVYKESEAQFMSNILNTDPTRFWAKARTLPGYKTARDSNTATINTIKKAVGLPVNQINYTPVKR